MQQFWTDPCNTNPIFLTEISSLVRGVAKGNDAYMNGDKARSLALTRYARDFSRVSPFGAWTTGRFDAAPKRLAEMAAYFTPVFTDLEVLAT